MSNNAVQAAERGMPSVNDAKPKNKSRVAMLVFFVVVLCIGATAAYWTMTRLRDSVQSSVKKDTVDKTPTVQKKTFDEAMYVPSEAPPAPAPEVVVPAVAGAGSVVGSQNTAALQPVAPPSQTPKPNMSRFDSPFVVNGGQEPGGKSKGGQSGFNPQEVLGSLAGQNGAAGNNPGSPSFFKEDNDSGNKGGLEGRLSPTRTPSVKAGSLGDLNLSVQKGKSIDCVTSTLIDASLPGMVSCRLVTNLMSANGRVVLAEAGSEVTGEQNGNMKQGQLRLFVLWNRIYTPNGVTMQIDSPGTDALGGAGVSGEIDNRWMARVGGALMLSTVKDIFAYQIAAMSSKNSGNQSNTATAAFTNTTSSGEKLSEKILESTINIPPSFYLNQGSRISIFIARDLDFSSVYAIQAK